MYEPLIVSCVGAILELLVAKSRSSPVGLSRAAVILAGISKIWESKVAGIRRSLSREVSVVSFRLFRGPLDANGERGSGGFTSIHK